MAPVTVLLASDDPHRTIYTMLLQESGFRVVETMHARDVVRLAQDEEAAAVILDLQQMGAEGGDAREAFRAHLGPAVPVVVLSQTGALEIDRRRKTATLPKPCHPRDVVRALSALLGRRDRAARRARAALEEVGQSSSTPEGKPPPERPASWHTEEMRRLWEGLRSG